MSIPDSGRGWRMLDDPGLHTTFDILLLIISSACLDDFSPRGINQVDKPNCSKQVDTTGCPTILAPLCFLLFCQLLLYDKDVCVSCSMQLQFQQ